MSQIYKSAAGSGGVITSVTGANGVSASPATGAVVVSGVNATTSTVGVASFNSSDFTVNGSGQVSLIGTSPASYTNVTTAMSPYTVTATDYFLSVNSTAGPVTINLPNTPTANRKFIIKDRLGQAATNAITLTTPGGVTTIDGATTYVFTDNFESLEIWFQGANYEAF
jgi:hypothetical protein